MMSDQNVFQIKQRLTEVFKIHNTPPPEPRIGEAPHVYHHRALCHAQQLLPPDHAWRGVRLTGQPLDAVERHIVHDQVRRFKAPTGPIREWPEQCPRTGRVTVKFYGDPENVWGQFSGVRQRVLNIDSEMGTGANSPRAREEARATEQELKLAYAALDEKRAAIGLRP
jgi:hypothetical protein